MVKQFHRAGIEVILDVVYNHTAEGNHLGPTLSFRGIDNAGYYRLVPGDPRALLRHHRHREQLQRPRARVAAADHGLAAVLGPRDARRRVPVRPRRGAGPRVPLGRPARGVLRPGQPGPGGQPGQADRRAVGRRRGRLPGRRVPGAVDGVERQVPRHRPRLLARRAGEPGGVRVAVHRQQRPVREGQPPPDGVDQLRDGARRFHAARPRLLQREAQLRRTARTTATGRATTAPGTTARRARPRTARSTRCGSGRSATSSRRCCCPRACR